MMRLRAVSIAIQPFYIVIIAAKWKCSFVSESLFTYLYMCVCVCVSFSNKKIRKGIISPGRFPKLSHLLTP